MVQISGILLIVAPQVILVMAGLLTVLLSYLLNLIGTKAAFAGLTGRSWERYLETDQMS